MITERDLQEAIAECQGVRDPNANTCIKLAAFYTIRNEMYGKKEEPSEVPSYSYSDGGVISIDSDTDFSRVVNGMEYDRFLPVIDELMETLSAINPRLYNAVIRKLK